METKYSVTFEREVVERAVLWVDGISKHDAILRAKEMLTSDDWEREDVGEEEAYAQTMKF